MDGIMARNLPRISEIFKIPGNTQDTHRPQVMGWRQYSRDGLERGAHSRHVQDNGQNIGVESLDCRTPRY